MELLTRQLRQQNYRRWLVRAAAALCSEVGRWAGNLQRQIRDGGKAGKFRQSWANGWRCIVPANWESGKAERWIIQQPGGVPMGIAGIYLHAYSECRPAPGNAALSQAWRRKARGGDFGSSGLWPVAVVPCWGSACLFQAVARNV